MPRSRRLRLRRLRPVVPALSRSGPAALLLAALVTASTLTPAQAGTSSGTDFDAIPPGATEPRYREQQLTENGVGGFPNYRIPALAVTNSGDLLASYDGRPSAIDAPGPNSILQRRSGDSGATWGPQTVVSGGREQDPVEGYSDPSLLVDRVSGDVFNFHVKSFDQGFTGSQPGTDPTDRDVLHAAVSVSRDEGETWQTEVITDEVTSEAGWRSRFAASGQGIQLRYGEHAGRLVQQYTIIDATGDFRAVSVYSDDHGQSWQVGEPVGTGMDENKTVELSDGRVMLNSRDSARSGFRKVAYSTDGGVSYGPVSLDRELPDPANNASIVRAYPNAAEGSRQARVLLFSNAASTAQRVNGVVRMSYDDGETWPVSRVFQPAGMAYSTLATLPNGDVGLLYEPAGGNGGIRFAAFSLAWLQGVGVSLTAPALSVERGGTATVLLRLDNQEGRAVAVDGVDVAAPEGWDVALDGVRSRLPGRSSEAELTVTVPATAAGGRYEIGLTLRSGERRAQGTVEVQVPHREGEGDGTLVVTGGELVGGPRESYAVGDVLRFGYRVSSRATATTTVSPTGNLRDLDPAVDARNCRWRDLPPGSSYGCDFPYRALTVADLAAGRFTPVTEWTSVSASGTRTVQHRGPTVVLR